MLPHSERLRAEQVRAVLKNGKVLRTPTIVGKYVPAKSSKVAVVVSKKVAKKAVVRNSIRRGVYGALPHPLPGAVEVVLLVQKNTPDYIADVKTICSKLFS